MGRISIKFCPDTFIKKAVKTILFSGLMISAGSLCAEEQIIDKVLAEVGGEAITLSEVRVKVEKGPLIEVSPYPLKESDEPNSVALNDLVNKKLILQKAGDIGIDISEESLNEEINSFLSRRSLSRESLDSALLQQGMTYEQYKEDFRTQMIINQFEGREIMPQVKITDKDLQLFYIKNFGGLAENIKISLKRLTIQIPTNAADSVKELKKQLVDKAFQELESGMPFDQAVKIYSDSNSGSTEEANLAQVYLKDLAPDIQLVVKDLEEGKFSKPIVIGEAAFIFYVSKREFADSAEYKKEKAKLETMLRQQEMGRLLSRWLEVQRRRSDIKIRQDKI